MKYFILALLVLSLAACERVSMPKATPANNGWAGVPVLSTFASNISVFCSGTKEFRGDKQNTSCTSSGCLITVKLENGDLASFNPFNCVVREHKDHE